MTCHLRSKSPATFGSLIIEALGANEDRITNFASAFFI